MLQRIIRHEWKALSAERTPWPVAAGFALVIAYGVANGTAWVQARREAVRIEDVAFQKRMDKDITLIERYEQNSRATYPVATYPDAFALQAKLPPERRNEVPSALAPTMAAGQGAKPSLPPAPLAALSVGQGDLYPPSTLIRLWNSKNDLWGETEIENPLNLLAGRFDLAFVVVYLYPLLILALSYNLISGEKEQGTLALLLSQPVSMRTFAWGKVAARGLIVLALTVLAATMGFFLGGVGPLGPDTAARLGLWLAVVTTYGAFWFALAVAVNASGWPSAMNATSLAVLWLTLVVVIPTLLNLAVTSAYPPPSRVEWIQAKRRAANEVAREADRVMADFYKDHPGLLEADGKRALKGTATFYANSQEVGRRLRALTEAFGRQLTAQQALVDRLRYISPAIVTQDILNDLSGNGPARYRYFQAQVEQYYDRWHSFFLPLVFSGEVMTPHLYRDIPRFEFREESAAQVAGRAGIGLAGLLIPTALVAAYSTLALRRYSIAG